MFAMFVAGLFFASDLRAGEPVAKQDAEAAAKAEPKPKPVPLDAQAPVTLNQLNDPPGRVKALAKRPLGPKLMLVSKVTREIAQQGRLEWRKEGSFRRYSDYSSQVNFGLTNRQLIAALSQRLDSHPAVDAYVRWQLLSFAPDFTVLKDIELKRLVANLPSLTQLPPPPKAGNIIKGDNGARGYFFSGTQRAFLSDLVPVSGTGLSNPRLSVIGGGGGISAASLDPQKAIEAARNQTYDYVQAGTTVEYLNGPAIHYRDALVRLIPDTAGQRLEVLFQDLKERISAGDPGYKDAAQAFYNEAQRTRNDGTISAQARAKLVYQMRELARKKTSVVQRIQIDNAGNLKPTSIVVRFPEKFVPPLLANLKGPDR